MLIPRPETEAHRRTGPAHASRDGTRPLGRRRLHRQRLHGGRAGGRAARRASHRDGHLARRRWPSRGRNARAHGVADRIALRADRSARRRSPGTFDLIVANPPYVRAPSGRRCSRKCAITSPPVALLRVKTDIDRRIATLRRRPPRSEAGGYLLFEFGFGQEQDDGRRLDSRSRTSLRMDGIARLQRHPSHRHRDSQVNPGGSHARWRDR